MAQVFETIMLLCFGVSWPFNIIKSLRARTAKGKSILFETCVIIGYICGLIGKFVGGNITYVVAVYILDLVMVSIDLSLTLRNRKLDRETEAREKEAGK